MSRIARSPSAPGCQRMAMLVAPDATALSNSSRLATNPLASVVNPVMFPPGRARLATRPLPTGSAANVTTGDGRSRSLGSLGSRRRRGHNNVHLEPNELGRQGGELILPVCRPAVLDDDVLSLDPSQ